MGPEPPSSGLCSNSLFPDYDSSLLRKAQYFRDPAQLGLYMTLGTFLADINNEVLVSRNRTYASNLATLQNLVLVLFQQDKTVVPKESTWFGSEAPVEEDIMPLVDTQHDQQSFKDGSIIPMRQQPLYVDDYIGLHILDERGAIDFVTCPGTHMDITGCWEGLVKEWIGKPFPA